MNKILIEDITHGGAGLGKIEGKIVFVEGALPGEIVFVEIVEDRKDYSIARVVEFEKTSNSRVKPACEYYGLCGGCDMQHAEYNCQVYLKKRILASTLKRIGGIDIENIYTVPSKKAFNYRRRVKFKCKGTNWGFYRKKSRDVVSVEYCFLSEDKINEYIKNSSCIDREIVLSDDNKINRDEMFLDLSEVVEGLYLTFGYGDFVQVNRDVNIKLVKMLVESIKDKGIKTVFDFFGGIGNFSLPLAASGVNVVSFDSNRHAVLSFNKNAGKFGLNRFAKSFVKNLIRPFNINTPPPQCVILDPPRTGAKRVIEYIINHKPEYVFYISCEPSTLSRDLKNLKDYYIIKKVILLDMFPQTHHFETLIELILK